MTPTVACALMQMNARVGDVSGNTAQILDAIAAARSEGTRVLITPELALTGYPPEDLLLRPALMTRIEDALRTIAAASEGMTVIVGAPQRAAQDASEWALGHQTAGPARLHNSLVVCQDGEVLTTYHKQSLPNYQVFDEHRYFVPGNQPCCLEVDGLRLGLLICEDVWVPSVVAATREAGAEILIVANASPFAEGKSRERRAHLIDRVQRSGVPLIYLNTVGGQDELVFDGGSMVLNAAGELVAQAPYFESAVLPVVLEKTAVRADWNSAVPSDDALLYQALVTGVHDYVGKTGFKSVLLGLSGGIDSALTLQIAADALGPERVHAVMMPYTYTAEMSIEDAQAQAARLGVQFSVTPIEPMVTAFMDGLAPYFEGHGVDTTEENLQSRCRGVVLMALSNKLGALVLTTGNKSEMAVGYATLYGDMAGGFAVLKDVWKTRVYALARYVNRDKEWIPTRVIIRPPSAELAPGQEDADSLPPYPVLDAMLARYIEQDQTPDEISAAGFAADDVRRMCRLVDINEYKRRQAAVGTRVTGRGFGRDRRYPIANGWRF
ncbi:MAG: NAD+ synthase [Litorivicinaceae bacterium]